jgi:hypothetical protein
MILRYKYGFNFNEILYGWKESKLYRLPQMIGKRFYPLKEVPYIEQKRASGMFRGYLLYGNKRKSMEQLKSMTHYIDFEHEIIKDKDVPF